LTVKQLMAKTEKDAKPHAKDHAHHLIDESELENKINAFSKSHKKDFFWVGVLFAIGGIILFVLYHTVPSAENAAPLPWKIPRKIEDLRELAGIAQQYYHSNPTYVTIMYVYLYIFLQTFGVPGPAILGIIGGALFGPVKGFILANFCALMGAILCYYLSLVIGKTIILKYFPGLLRKFNKFMNEHEDNLVWYMLFLRITPLLPNWFINYSSPIVGMPFKVFLPGTFLGLLPNSFILVRTGVLIHEVSEFGLNLKAFLFLGGLALLMLVPTLLTRKAKKNFETSPEKPKKEKDS